MMKKSFFYTFAIVAAMTSCSSQEDSLETSFETSNDVLALNIAAPSLTEQSRGTGTIGTTDPNTNQWQGQRVKVYMFNKGTLTPTKLEDVNGQLKPIFDNTEVFAPNGVAVGPVSKTNGTRSYYPISGASDFWGYRTDGAESGQPIASATNIAVPFEINGSQDIMVGKTDNSKITAVGEEYLYSAKSARLGVVPELDFKHLLTRLTFSIRAYEDMTEYSDQAEKIPEEMIMINNNQSLVDKDLDFCLREFGVRKVSLGVFVDSIMIESATTGKVIVAYTAADADKEQKIVWDNTKVRNLTLMDRPAIDGVPQPTEPLKKMEMSIVPRGVYKQLGEALLLKPAERYNIRVAMHQYKQDGLNDGKYTRKAVLWPNKELTPHTIDLSELKGKGAAGYSYNIRLGVSGLEEIRLNAVLENWLDGGIGNKDIE